MTEEEIELFINKHFEESGEGEHQTPEFYKSFLKKLLPGIATGQNQFKYPVGTHELLFMEELIRRRDEFAKVDGLPELIDAIKEFNQSLEQYTQSVSEQVAAGQGLPAGYLDLLEQLNELYERMRSYSTELAEQWEARKLMDQQPIRENHDTTNYSDSRETQYLRRLSTYAYVWLIQQGIDPGEVQALWDGKKIYIATNNDRATKALKRWNKRSEVDFSKIEDDQLQERAARHIKGIQNPGEEVPAALKGAPIVFAGGNEEGKHAEIHLVDFWQGLRKRGIKNIYVAGVKRPCLACYVRLLEFKESMKKKGITFHHKTRPGLFWPSQAALRGISRDGAKAILRHLARFAPHYLTGGRYDYDSDSASEGSPDTGAPRQGTGTEAGAATGPLARVGQAAIDAAADAARVGRDLIRRVTKRAASISSRRLENENGRPTSQRRRSRSRSR